MRYADSIEYLEGLNRLPFSPSSLAGLDRARFLMHQLGDPHHSFRSVHVAGSTGKGSTTAMLGAMLAAAGFKTGMFRSPHLQEYTERISVDGYAISEEDWAGHFATLLPIAERMREGAYSNYELGRPTIFELLFALAALHFREVGVQWAALETGLGGRLDATNLVQSDVAVITNVSLEHTRVLGRTVPEIAREKAAIIKPDSSAVTGAEEDALAVIEERAATVRVPLLVSHRDITLGKARGEGGQTVSLALGTTGIQADLPSAALYQVRNAAVAFAAALSLRTRGVTIPDVSIRRGLERFSAPGRFEAIPGERPVILDGAHNPAGITALAEALGDRRLPLLFAAMEDKDIAVMARTIAPHTTEVIVTQVPGTDRSATIERMVEAFRSARVESRAEPDTGRALETALGRACGNPLLIAGSLYLVGFAREHLLAVPA